jgi:hypothetical protein
MRNATPAIRISRGMRSVVRRADAERVGRAVVEVGVSR